MNNPQSPGTGRSTRCVCYTSNLGYLFPSLVSAQQVRKHLPESGVDVVMVHIGPDSPSVDMFRQRYEAAGITFISVPDDAIERMHIMYGRMFLDQILPEQYQHILYIDGDTQVIDALTPLITCDLPGNSIVAAPDPMTIAHDWTDRGSVERHIYLRSIGLHVTVDKPYYNSGVIRFDRAAWRDISADVLSLVRSRPTPFRFPDQDALNVVAANRILPSSLRWNFPSFLMRSAVDGLVQPAIYHFMSNPRPWQGPFQPWGRHWQQPYRDIVQVHPQLATHAGQLSRGRYAKYTLQQLYKKFTETPDWVRADVLTRVREMEDRAYV